MACKEEAHSVASYQRKDTVLWPQKAEAAMLGVFSTFLYSRKKMATKRMKRLWVMERGATVSLCIWLYLSSPPFLRGSPSF